MNRKFVYIISPMRGRPRHNADAIFAAHKRLEDSGEGWTVITPLGFARSFGIDCDAPDEAIPADRLRDCMKAELAAIPHLDAVYLLKGWERSEGAREELRVALENKLIVMVEGNENGAEVAQ